MDGNAKIWPKEREKKKEENSRYSCPKNDEVRKGTQHTHIVSTSPSTNTFTGG